MTEPTPKTGASMNRHGSKQNYSTPDDLFLAIRKRFGRIAWDLAADESNHKAFEWFDEATDSLQQPWHQLEKNWLYLNPPFNDITPWALKCSVESKLGAKILLLVPASVGSNWFADFVFNQANVFFLSPRVCFDGKSPFPKDVMLCQFNSTLSPGVHLWRWE